MRFLIDPAGVRLGPAAWFFLLALCLLLPLAAVRQHRQFVSLPRDLTRLRIYTSGMATHAVLLILVWSVIRSQDFVLLAPYRANWWHVILGTLSLALGLLPFLRGERKDPVAKKRTRLIAPRTPAEFALFYLLSLSAGFVEQLAYRGVLFALLGAITRSWWLTAMLSAAFFGIAHLFQGRKSAGVAGLIGLRDHIVVGLTGTLWIAIAVHILHDAIAGTFIGMRGRREERFMKSVDTPEATHALP